jgi:hypothetical protein
MLLLKAYDRDKFGDHIEAEAGSKGRHRGVARRGTDGGRQSRANRGVPQERCVNSPVVLSESDTSVFFVIPGRVAFAL